MLTCNGQQFILTNGAHCLLMLTFIHACTDTQACTQTYFQESAKMKAIGSLGKHN